MTPQQYIKEQLNRLKQPVEVVETGDPVADIYKAVMSKKFRKYSVSPDYQESIKQTVKKCVKNQKPLPLVWVFGGYKLWSLKEAPRVDWAELFSLIYFVRWMQPVLKLHQPGVWFDFFSDDVIVPMMNNVPQSDTKAYIQSFQELLKFILPFLPKGFKFTLNRVEDQYKSFDDFKTELDQNIKKLAKQRKTKPLKLISEQIAAIDMNVIPNKKQQQTKHWRDEVQIIHDAYSQSSKRRPYYRNPDKIMVLNTPIPGALAIGTTKTSVVKFWVGVGALKKRGDSFIETILSPKQLKQAKFTQEKISISKLTDKNFRQIRLLSN